MSLKNQEVTYTPSGTRSERKLAKRAAAAEAIPSKRRLFHGDDDRTAEHPDRERYAWSRVAESTLQVYATVARPSLAVRVGGPR